MPTDVISTTVTNDGVQLFSNSQTLVDNSRNLFNMSGGVPTGTTNMLFNVAFALDDLTAVEITCDQVVDLYTNATDGTGGQHFTWVAGATLTWVAGGVQANPFTADVTKLYINNASGNPANLKMSFLIATE